MEEEEILKKVNENLYGKKNEDLDDYGVGSSLDFDGPKKSINWKFIVVFCIIIILAAIIIYFNSRIYVGKITNNGIVFPSYIEDAIMWDKDDKEVTFKNNIEDINSCNITSLVYTDLVEGKYDIKISKFPNMSNEDKIIIDKLISMKMINNNTLYSKYLAIKCGFKDKKELIKYTKAVFDLLEKYY